MDDYTDSLSRLGNTCSFSTDWCYLGNSVIIIQPGHQIWIRSMVSIIVNCEHHPIPNELLCTHVEAVQKQLEIFLFTCLQNLLVFSNQVQLKSKIRLVQKTISKISFKGDKIGWNLEQKIPQQQVFHLACLYAHNAFGLATPYDLSFTVKSIEVSAFIEGELTLGERHYGLAK